MKSMSQVARLSACPETLEEARLIIDQQEKECRALRERWAAADAEVATLRKQLADSEAFFANPENHAP